MELDLVWIQFCGNQMVFHQNFCSWLQTLQVPECVTSCDRNFIISSKFEPKLLNCKYMLMELLKLRICDSLTDCLLHLYTFWHLADSDVNVLEDCAYLTIILFCNWIIWLDVFLYKNSIENDIVVDFDVVATFCHLPAAGCVNVKSRPQCHFQSSFYTKKKTLNLMNLLQNRIIVQ